MNLFFLAAGFGTRLRPLTEKYPKPCVPFLNVPLGLYQYRYIDQSSISKAVVNTFHLPKKTEELYLNQSFFKSHIDFSHEKNKILGSAGGLKLASSYFSDPTVLMMNADEVFFTKEKDFLKNALKQHLKNKNLATLIVMQHPEAGNKFGAIWCENKTVIDIGKNPVRENLKPYHYIGIIFLSKEIYGLIPENTETNIFYDILIKQLPEKKVEAYEIACDWFETGNGHDYLLATKSCLENLTQETFNFINQYDECRLIKNSQTVSLVSKKIHLNESRLYGYNVISKTTNPNSLLGLGRIENTIFFDNEIVNSDYFKVSLS